MQHAVSISAPKEMRRTERIADLVLTEVAYPPGFRIPWHSHELAAFALTLRGSTTEAFAGLRFDNTESGMVVRPAGENHWDAMGEKGAKCFLIELPNSWSSDLPQFSAVMRRPFLHPAGVVTRLAQRTYREWLQNDTASKIGVQALALEIAAHLIREAIPAGGRPGPYAPVWLKRVRQRLDDGYAETPSLAELAAIGGVHPTHLARHFRQHYGSSVGEYLRQRRVDAASQMLTATDTPLTDIALATGFAHHAHFTTIFKRLTGLTPSEFRRMRRAH